MTGFNVGCLDEVDTFKFKDITVNNGLNHPLIKNKCISLSRFTKSKKIFEIR